ncbi:RNA polymerase sigma-70 factor, ECF subfamily [Cyclobacterium lianum]|uniref:RNA polymerase sigma-70 factor, ECF subfamily n=1 Tax=Cyclobacterium lianum TaxID=388280 RepID=A0A1M7JSR7_9BACT|nr:RNA polymerase sigma-70 factor [Cyclobacterium lianum]SHM56140.1 RNA polymerase sigma-70 factor, ECF subfamily [Cyclobacterium lianum]
MKVSDHHRDDLPELMDEAVFEKQFKNLFGPLHAYAAALLKDQEAASEIVQTVFLKLWEKRENLQISTSLKAYLYKCVYHDCLNYLKHEKVKQKHLELNRQEIARGSSTVAAFSLEHKEIADRFANALGGLPDKCRTVFLLSRVEELRYKEIAERLGLSVKTVEAHMGKALKTLRVALAEFLPLLLMLWSYLF